MWYTGHFGRWVINFVSYYKSSKSSKKLLLKRLKDEVGVLKPETLQKERPCVGFCEYFQNNYFSKNLV